MRQFYHGTIVEKSWRILRDLEKKFEFVLIGGWAVWAYTQALKSKDIDFIIEYSELERLSQGYELTKNPVLHKYEIKIEQIDIDIYVPFYSKLGLPIDFISKNSSRKFGFVVPRIEVLLIMKQVTYNHRKGTPKGEKDKIDVFSLLQLESADWDFYKKTTKKFKLQNLAKDLEELLSSTREIPELGLNPHNISKLKKSVAF